jgi:tetratricopeptide (TPR) repeat protein
MRVLTRIHRWLKPAATLVLAAFLCHASDAPAPAPAPAPSTVPTPAPHPSGDKDTPGPAIEFHLPPSTNRINLLDTNHPPIQPIAETGAKIPQNEKAEALARQIENQADAEAATTKTNLPAINQSKRHSDSLPESPNILSERPPTPPQLLKNFEAKLDLAHSSRTNHDYETAEKCLTFILEGRAPETLKGAALLEYASLCVDRKQLPRAQQIYAQWLRKFPEHPDSPEILLRQGLIYRDMGAPDMARTKFFSVMSSAVASKWDRMDYYKKMVLRAQTEIADTYYLQGNYPYAIEKYLLLLKPTNPDIAQLNRETILFKLIHCLSSLQRYPETVAQCEVYLHDFPDAAEQAEIRYMMASALKKMGRDEESIQQTMLLLQSQKDIAPEKWRYWQQRAGNDIANQLFQQGDYINALIVYKKLAQLDTTLAWQLPVNYQLGLVYEQLKQPEKAMDCYKAITSRDKEINVTNSNPNLTTVLDMARFRTNRILWEQKADRLERNLRPTVPLDTIEDKPAPAPAPTPSHTPAPAPPAATP